MQQLQDFYLGFLGLFPHFLQPIISIGLAILLVVAAVQVLKKNFIYLILLVILLPASIPILKNIVDTLIGFVKFVLGL